MLGKALALLLRKAGRPLVHEDGGRSFRNRARGTQPCTPWSHLRFPWGLWISMGSWAQFRSPVSTTGFVFSCDGRGAGALPNSRNGA